MRLAGTGPASRGGPLAARLIASLVLIPHSLAPIHHMCGFVCRLDRLDYLVSTRRDRGISYKQALTMPDDEFGEMYAGFKQWRAQRGVNQ